jgi:hypothetical protein
LIVCLLKLKEVDVLIKTDLNVKQPLVDSDNWPSAVVSRLLGGREELKEMRGLAKRLAYPQLACL